MRVLFKVSAGCEEPELKRGLVSSPVLTRLPSSTASSLLVQLEAAPFPKRHRVGYERKLIQELI